MPLARRLALMLAVAGVVGCHGSGSGPAPLPQAAPHALGGLGRVRVAVLPTYALRLDPRLPWIGSIGAPDDVRRMMDADIAAALEEHGLTKTWLLPNALAQAFKRNSTYGADPFALDEEPLRSPVLAVDMRLPEPLASQLRTLVALHDDVRLVLAPVELRLEPVGAAGAPATDGRGVLRLVLIDTRMANVRWLGEVAGDSAAAFGPVVTASVAAKMAAVVGAP